MVNLSDFTAKEDPRDYLNNVFKFDEYLAATDGRIAIIDYNSKGKFVGFSDEWHKQRKATETLSKCFTLPSVKIKEVQKITEGDYRNCKECDGTGKSKDFIECPECDGDGSIDFYTDYNLYEVECKTCDGYGEIKSDTATDCSSCDGSGKTLLNVPFLKCEYNGRKQAISGHYLQKISSLPNSKIAHFEGKYYFTFDGGMGACMPMYL